MRLVSSGMPPSSRTYVRLSTGSSPPCTTARTDRGLAAGHATARAVTDGHRLGFAVAAGLVAAAAVVTATVLRRPPVDQPAGVSATCPA